MKNMLKEPLDAWHNERYYEHDGLMNHEAAVYLLVTLKNVLAKHGIKFMPMFGTLLGAIREHDFIKNDTDIDVLIYGKDKDAIFNLRPELEKYDIHLYCYCLPWIFTFKYKSITCDFYPLYESAWPWTKWYNLLWERYINKKFFVNTEDYEWFGETFQVPANPERLLAYLYGNDWRIPQSKKSPVESKLFFWRYAYRFMQRCKRYLKRHLYNKAAKQTIPT